MPATLTDETEVLAKPNRVGGKDGKRKKAGQRAERPELVKIRPTEERLSVQAIRAGGCGQAQWLSAALVSGHSHVKGDSHV